MTPLVIEMPGLPVPWARAGRGKGLTFTPARQRGAMADLKVVAKQAMNGRPLFDVPLRVVVSFQYPWPKSLSPKKRVALGPWRTGRPDADNLFKLVADGLNGIVWQDDAIIAVAGIIKLYGDDARTMIEIFELRQENVTGCQLFRKPSSRPSTHADAERAASE